MALAKAMANATGMVSWRVRLPVMASWLGESCAKVAAMLNEHRQRLPMALSPE
jgi:SpoVK/Ycf46/Vps4 family AAA+-type ATPase